MPIPRLSFDDPVRGTPRQAVPVRYACLVANWPVQTLATLVVGVEAAGGPVLKVWELRADGESVGQIHPQNYAVFANLSDPHASLKELPRNHFVWSDDLVTAYSEYVDLFIGRENAWGAAMGTLWEAALGSEEDAIQECPDMGSLASYGSNEQVCKISCVNDVYSITYLGQSFHIKASVGLQYIEILLLRKGKEISCTELVRQVNPPDLTQIPSVQIEDTYIDTENSVIDGRIGGGGQAIDERALRETLTALRRLRQEQDAASDEQNHTLVEDLQRQIEELEIYIRGSVNNRGRIRDIDGLDQKNRKSVWKAINVAIDSLKNESPTLYQHLKDYITTGLFVKYEAPENFSWSR